MILAIICSVAFVLIIVGVFLYARAIHKERR